MPDTTQTIPNDIETETREHVETEVVEHREEYQVTTCEWCNGVHPTDDTVAVGLGLEDRMSIIEYSVRNTGHASITHELTINDTLEAYDLDIDGGVDVEQRIGKDMVQFEHLFANGDAHQAIAYTTTEPQQTVPYCAYCAGEVFGVDVDTALDAPAYQVYDQPPAETETGDETTTASLRAELTRSAVSVGVFAGLLATEMLGVADVPTFTLALVAGWMLTCLVVPR